MKIYAIVNEVELGVSLNSEEVMALGEGFAEIISSSELTNEFMKSVNDIVNAAANAAKPAEDKPEDEESEEPEEATDEERYIECYTFCDTSSNKEKAALVRAWLKRKEIKYIIDSHGIKKYVYKLTPQQLIELQDYLLDNDVASWEAII